jgi:hypothetical protein
VSKINLKIWILFFIIFIIFTAISFWAAFAVEEGTMVNLLTLFFNKLYYILRFPSHTLFFKYMRGNMFYLGLIFNNLLYAFIFERLYTFIKSK